MQNLNLAVSNIKTANNTQQAIVNVFTAISNKLIHTTFTQQTTQQKYTFLAKLTNTAYNTNLTSTSVAVQLDAINALNNYNTTFDDLLISTNYNIAKETFANLMRI